MKMTMTLTRTITMTMKMNPNEAFQGQYKQINFVTEHNCLKIKLAGDRPVGYLQSVANELN